jgi:hypothetical protein
MSLYESLQKVNSEEDVKDAYIKALGLKGFTKGLIDIQTEEIWFEAKDSGRHSSYAMFTQLLHYVQVALNKGETIPPFLAVIDTEKAAIMKTEDVLPFLAKKTVKWGKSASQYTQEALAEISAHIGTHFVSFKISTHEDEFISTVKAAIKSGDIIRTQITPVNLKQVFDKWVEMIGREIKDVSEEDYALCFFADIMHDGTVSTHMNLPAELLHKDGSPVFSLNGKLYELGSKEGYRQFWTIYHKPPKAEYRNYLLERRDSLIPIDERAFKGAFYTPLIVVDKAYDYLSKILGNNWQDEYFVWDMCCGVGNLEIKHSNPRNIFMSTLDQADVDVMKATKTCMAAEHFQYDYLNDDINSEGEIDYGLTNKLPLALQKAITEKKKILILINPPYAEAANADNTSISEEDNAENKKGVSKTLVAKAMDKQGYAARELFVQFLVRISKEIPDATVAIFSKLKYVNSPNFEKFRATWSGSYLGGFIVHSKMFDGLSGNFPIGFLVWTLNKNYYKGPINEISTEILDKKCNPIGEKKFYNIQSEDLLSDWIIRPRSNNQDALPLKNCITPTTNTKDIRGDKWADGAIGSMICKGSDLQNAGNNTALLSSGYCSAGAFFVTPDNLWQASIVFTVRRIVKQTWINDRDQFLKPTLPLSDDFKNDCLIWMLFNGSNLTAGADNIEWNGKKWSLVNHFIPFAEADVNSSGRFESDFMLKHLKNKILSRESNDVLDSAKILWRSYFDSTDTHLIREQLKLNRPDVGWYQVRKALQHRNSSGDYLPVDFSSFENAYEVLTDKLRPQVYELGFLKV